MWREEVGMMEMLLSYIGDFNHFDCWSNWRPILVDILSCHEDIRRQRMASVIASEENSVIERKAMKAEAAKNMEKFATTEEDSTSIIVPNFTDFGGGNGEYRYCIDEVQNSIATHATEVSTSAYRNQRVMDEEPEMLKIESVENSHETFWKLDGNAENAQTNSVYRLTFKGEDGTSPDLSINQNALPECSSLDHERGEERRRRPTTVEPLYPCPICDKKFGSNFQVTVHMRSHTGEQPYKCRVCGKSFSQKSNLKKHMMTHTGERPYSCHLCGRSFAQNAVLLRHFKTHYK